MTEKIHTLHPAPEKQGVNIDKTKYDQVRAAILDILGDQEEMTFRDLMAAVEERLSGNFEGSIGWYYTTVKLDLEARQLIQRIPDSSPQRLRLTG